MAAQGQFQEGKHKAAAFLSNFLLILVVLFIFGLFIREKSLRHNFLALSVMGQGLNFFDPFVMELLWWWNTKRIRFTKIPEKEFYQNPRKHLKAFCRALALYALAALVDGFLLT